MTPTYRTGDVITVIVTVPSMSVGAKIARLVLGRREAACVTILPQAVSYYWWKEEIERARECLMLMKTRRRLFRKLETTVRRAHPYDVPEIVALQVVDGSRDYLGWVVRETCRGAQ